MGIIRTYSLRTYDVESLELVPTNSELHSITTSHATRVQLQLAELTIDIYDRQLLRSFIKQIILQLLLSQKITITHHKIYFYLMLIFNYFIINIRMASYTETALTKLIISSMTVRGTLHYSKTSDHKIRNISRFTEH